MGDYPSAQGQNQRDRYGRSVGILANQEAEIKRELQTLKIDVELQAL